MGSYIELNDTLQLTTEQGFPKELNYDKHKTRPYKAEDFKGKVFDFKDKPAIRNFLGDGVRNFFVHNIDGKWLYWGLVHILEVQHDYEKKITSGKYEITRIYSPEDMKKAFKLIDERPELNYLDDKK